jgi:Family of unknown function (DUF6152)
MTTRTAVLVALCGFLITGVAVQGHHAVAGVYDLNKEVVLEGKLKKLNFTNPHASIELTVPDKKVKGKVVDWILTTASVQNLTRQGFSKSTIKPGDPLKVTILPAVNGNPAGFIRRLELGDKDFKFEID